MALPWQLEWLYVVLVAQVVQKSLASTGLTVYMDKYGDCNRMPYVEVDGDVYTILSQGGEAHDNLQCAITFRSVRNDHLCLSFRSLKITRCNVYLKIFSEANASGKPVASYNCQYEDDLPEMVCSDGKYLTVQLRKRELSREGYSFNLEVRERNEIDRFADGLDAFIMSIGVIIGLIVGVIVLVVVIAVIVVYCCCKRGRHHGLVYRHTPKSSSRTTTTTAGAAEAPPPVEPSAPPFPAGDDFGHCYPGNPPPAYTEYPPPYPGASEGEKAHV